jgi:hypothetical protein
MCDCDSYIDINGYIGSFDILEFFCIDLDLDLDLVLGLGLDRSFINS